MRGFGLLAGPWSDPQQAGLLTAAAHLLANSGPSLRPVGTGQAVGGAMLASNQAATQAQQLQEAKTLRDMQVSKAQREDEQAQQLFALRQRIMGGLLGGQQPGYGLPQSQVGGNGGLLESPTAPVPSGVSSGIGNDGFRLPPTSQLPGVNPQAALLMLSGDPGLSKVGSALQDANKPTDRQREAIALGLQPGSPAYNSFVGTQFTQGGAWQIDPATGQVRIAPGYAQGAGDVRGAEEAARARFDLIEVPDGRGGTRLMPRSQAALILGGGAVPPSPIPIPSPQGQGSMGYRAPEAERGANTRFAETVAAEMAKQYSDLLSADNAAPGKIANYQRLGNLLSQVSTGKFKGATTDIKAAAKSLGMDLSALGVADDVAPAQAARALSNQLALELRNPAGGAGMPGALSDKDREFLVSMIPGLENDPSAIPLMIDFRVRLAKREQQVAKMARDYKKRQGRFDDGFYDDLAAWSERNPLFTDADFRKPTPAPLPKRPGNRGGIQFLGFEGE